MPVDLSDNARFADYVNAIERLGHGGRWVGRRTGGTNVNMGAAAALQRSRKWNQQQPIADVVLVDGRFRVAAALKTLWHIDGSSVVLVHDWPSRKEWYGRVLAYYDIVDSVDELVVLARKSDLDWAAAAADLAKYVKKPDRRLV
jgi:hypothetical protein